jgi:hypothetical protein
METGRTLFSRFLHGEPMIQPAFVPFIRGVLSRVAGLPFQALTSDPTLWTSALQKTADLFDLDGVVVGFDYSLMAEACGCELIWEGDRPGGLNPAVEVYQTPLEQGRMKHFLEAASRLFEVCQKKRACLIALTGPVTLAAQVYGQEQGPEGIANLKQPIVQVTETLCQIRPDALLFMEEAPLALAEVDLSHRRIYNTLKNIAGHFTIPVGLYLEGYQHQTVNRFAKLKMDYYVLGPAADRGMPVLTDLCNLGEGSLGVGIGLPLDDLEKTREIIKQGIDLYRTGDGQGTFFTTHGPVTRDADLDFLHQVTKEVRQITF